VVSGGRDVGARLAEHPAIGKVMFTGSTATGKAIIKSSADTVKRLTLELGGNDAGIVLPDADPKAIAEGLFWGAFINTGQTCAALKRLYVHTTSTTPSAKNSPRSPPPCPWATAWTRTTSWARCRTRPSTASSPTSWTPPGIRRPRPARRQPRPSQPGYFYPTTLVADIDNDNPLVAEEQFGPALPIIRYSTMDEAVEKANALDVGLGASVWSSNLDAAREVAARIQAGTVWINKHGAVDPRIPFGGAKQSGYGLEFGVEGLKALGVPQVING
jgi:acyl-CoA reductase-like NAD-dependent aldehyde dehydrogenase